VRAASTASASGIAGAGAPEREERGEVSLAAVGCIVVVMPPAYTSLQETEMRASASMIQSIRGEFRHAIALNTFRNFAKTTNPQSNRWLC
jgi:hypothetical protein